MYTNVRSSTRVPPRAPPTYESVRYGSAPSADGADAPQSDTTLLLPQKGPASSWTQRRSLICVVLIALLIIIVHWRPGEDALDRGRIRREWGKEVNGHERVRRAWGEEVAGHEAMRAGWAIERRELVAEREQLVRERETWAHECEAGKREEERRRKEAADRVRAGFAWDGLQAQQRCQRHGAREYTARIVNVPRGYDPIQACKETAVEIHGMKIPNPLQCEDRGCGGVVGHWTVDYGEPTCVTHFDNFKDKGCTFPGSGLRRIESHLENLQGSDDWRDMCSTTPADFLHLHFDSPHMCENWGKYGVWGMWDIDDREC
ncbi:hypothetical protein B0H11DRAFT_2282345 [Mycena galericulata]|nr:hypothetical protein B0H11DRAFT_2282345 [Mycena galericulata]